jgi:hypothetical protein
MAADGTWKVTVNTPMGEQDATLSFKENGQELTGTLSNASGTVPIENGKVEGNSVSWKAHLASPFPMTLDCVGVIDGDTITGTVNTSFGASPFQGTRQAE